MQETEIQQFTTQ